MRNLRFAALLAVIVVAIQGCATQSNVNVSVNKANATAVNTNEVAATPAEAVTASATAIGSLATPEDAYRTAYALREKKDVAGLKKVLSKDVIEFLTMMGEGEKKSLDDEIASMFDKPQAKTDEFRNVKIKGDRASLEYPDDKGVWKTMDFVKEEGDWKMAFPPKEDIEIENGVPDKKGKN